MAVITEFYETRDDGVKLFRSYSDEGKKLIQNETGAVYDDAVDVEGAPYTYSESEEETELTADAALRIILGGGL